MESLTLFTWGYWGWGSATEQLIEAADAVETARGYKPPMFVDIRLRREGRALGFKGAAFQDTVGASRYRWLDRLGNLAVTEGGAMRIKEPAAAKILLDMTIECAKKGQRILYFCACQHPGVDGHERSCHRTMVARFVLEAAAQRMLPIQIVEWPGGEPEPEGVEVRLSKANFKKVSAGAASIPLKEPVALAKMAAIPWGSTAKVIEQGGGQRNYRLCMTGPAQFRKSGWCLPIFTPDEDVPLEKIPQYTQQWREEYGYNMRRSHP